MTQPSAPTPSSSALAESRGFTFGPFRLDLASYQLLRDGAPVDVTSKAFDTLALLLSQRHRVVTKEELLAAVWRDAIVTDDSLVQCISSLRRALGDDATNPTYISTVARRGYRFTAPATEWVEALQPPVATTLPRPSTERDPAPAADRRRPSRQLPLAVAGVVLLVVGWYIGARTGTATGSGAEARTLRFAQQPPPGTTLASGGVLSPSGSHIAFAAEDLELGRTFLWVRALDAAQPRRIEGTDGAQRPFWSPDGRFIGFFANGRLKTVAMDGGAPTDVASVGPRPAGAAWSPNGQIVFSTWLSGFSSVSASGGAITAVTSLGPGEFTHAWPQLLPDGDHFLYSTYGDNDGIFVGSLSRTERTRILDADPGAIYSPLGYLVFTRGGILTAQAFDPATLELSGEPFTIAPGSVAFPSMTNGTILSAAGGLLAFGGAQGESELAWFDRSGRRLGAIATPAPLHNPSLSEDGKRLFANTFPPAQNSVWAIDLDRGTASRVVADGTMPVLGPDGRTLAYTATRADGAGIFLTDLDAADEKGGDALALSADRKTPVQFTRDRQSLIYYAFSPKGQDLWILPLSGNRTPMPLVATAANEIQGRLSPDGLWLAYASDESGRWEVYVQSFPEAKSRVTVSTAGGAEPYWRGDGRELYYLADDRSLMAVDVAPGSPLRLGRPRLLFRPRVLGEPATYRSHYVATDDGQRFLVDVLRDPALDPVTLLLNWAGAR